MAILHDAPMTAEEETAWREMILRIADNLISRPVRAKAEEAVRSQLETVTAERDALREEISHLREEVTRHKNRAAHLAEGVDGMPPRHQSGRR